MVKDERQGDEKGSCVADEEVGVRQKTGVGWKWASMPRQGKKKYEVKARSTERQDIT